MNIDKNFDFNKILEYHKIDQELIALEVEVQKSEERKKFALAKSALNMATETINKITQDANDLLNAYNAMRDKINALHNQLDEFDGILDDMQDAQEADYYLKSIQSIQDKICELEREASTAASKIDSVNAKYHHTWEQGVSATKTLKVAKAEYDAFVAKHQPKVVEINSRLKALKADIPDELMSLYLTFRAEKKLPAVVPYNVNAGSCGRCFTDLPNDTKSKLRNPGDYAECPNCRRILFVPKA